MVSSVRRGLADVRDAVRPVIDILGYEPIRFEDVTPLPVPSRAVCVDAVRRSDVYLLILGDEYGDPMVDTGLAPTAEEWTVARQEGKPIVVFRKANITPEPRQADFIAEVEAYGTGVFRGTFNDTADLLGKLKEALASAASMIQPMRPRRLTETIFVPWRADDHRFGTVGVILETHVIPIGPVDRLRTTAFPDLARRLARAGREHGLFDEGDALTFPTAESTVTAESQAAGRGSLTGLSVTLERAISVWEPLPIRIGAAILDEGQFTTRIARDLRLAASLDLIAAAEAAVAIGFNSVEMLGRPTGPTSMTFPLIGGGHEAPRLEPSEAVPTAALPRIADELALELVSRLSLRLGA